MHKRRRDGTRVEAHAARQAAVGPRGCQCQALARRFWGPEAVIFTAARVTAFSAARALIDRSGKRRDQGFTLLEILVALVVLGFVLAGIAGGVQFGQRAADMQARSIAAHADMGAADRLLRRLVAAMDPGTVTEDPKLSAAATALGFTTDLGSAAAALGDGEADIGLGVDGAHRLVVRWTPALHAIRLGPQPPPRSAVLLDGVERVDFAYWGHGEGGGGAWLTSWTEKDIPPLVRIRLRFTPEAHRAWPDIVAATERQRAVR